jgi:hypothetical protein
VHDSGWDTGHVLDILTSLNGQAPCVSRTVLLLIIVAQLIAMLAAVIAGA